VLIHGDSLTKGDHESRQKNEVLTVVPSFEIGSGISPKTCFVGLLEVNAGMRVVVGGVKVRTETNNSEIDTWVSNPERSRTRHASLEDLNSSRGVRIVSHSLSHFEVTVNPVGFANEVNIVN